MKIKDLKDPLSSPKSKGKRLMMARHLAGFASVQSIIDQYGDEFGLSFGTWRNWEIGLANGLSAKGAEKAVTIFNYHNVICSIDWLVHGIGPAPVVIKDIADEQYLTEVMDSLDDYKQKQDMMEELMLFRQVHKNTVDLFVSDQSMSPIFEPGDLVAGMMISKRDRPLAVGKHCIVETMTGELKLRSIVKINNENSYEIRCINSEASDRPYEYDVKLRLIAPIIWHRKPLHKKK